MLTFSRHARAALFIAAFASAAATSTAAAQPVLGPGDDAWHLPRGALRVGLSTRFSAADEAFFASGARSPLGAPYSGLLGSGELPTLQWLETAVRDLSGTPGFRASLGTARADVRRATARIPFEAAIGLTSRVMVFGAVAFHTGEQEVNWLLDGTGATVGANPALSLPGLAAGNAALVRGLDTAAAQLERLADDCVLDPASDPRCAQITAELTQVRGLIADSRTTTDALAQTYGGRDGVSPSPFVPLNDGDAHEATRAYIAQLRERFERYGTESIGEGSGPAGAGVPLTAGELRALLSSEAYAYEMNQMTRRYQQGFGDTDVGVSLLVFDGLRDTSAWTRLGAATFGARQSVAFVYRRGTGTPAHPDDPLRVATGDGQDDLEFVSATDIVLNRHAWVSVSVRYTLQQARDAIVRIPDGSGSPFIPVERRRLAHHEPGNRVEVSVSPRWVLNEFLAFGLGWRWMRQAGETYDEIAPFTDGIPLHYTGPDLSAHEAGVGFTWSSLAAWHRGSARWPIEIQWDRRLVVAGEGGVPRFSSDRIAVRWYARLWGR